MKRPILIAFLLLATSIGLGHWAERRALAHRAVPNPVVTNLNNSGAGSLRQAISDADAGSMITFQPGLTGTITLASELFIDKDMTIQGPGANLLTISGNNAVRVFNIKMGNVTLSGLKIANGRRASADVSQGIVFANFPTGGGIFNDSGVVTVTDCTLSGNSVSGVTTGSFNLGGSGGGVYNLSGSMTLTGCTLSGNSASGGSSTAAGGGGGITNAIGIMNLTDCTFSNNSAVSGPTGTSGAGGAILNGSGRLNLQSCTLNGNSAVANGSGPDVTSSGSFGGGIYNLQGIVSLTICTLSGNSVSSTSSPVPVSTGGGIYNTVGTISLTACTVSGNSATASSGSLGNTGSGGGIASQQGAVTLANTIIAGNTAADFPDTGAIFTSQGYNLIGNNGGYDNYFPPGNPNANHDIIGTNSSPINPLLGPLANNGGPTKTMALLAASPAIDKGKSFGLSADQRGQARPDDNSAIPPAPGGDNSDIGAFELKNNTAPIARCQSLTVTAGASCSANASINNGSYDPDSGDSITVTQSPAGPYPFGTTTVTLTVTDSHGASSSCTATVTVVDNTAPTITLNGANPMTVECPYGFVDPGATTTDNCAASLAVTTSGSINPAVPGSYTITYTANDGHGNVATQTRTVNVVDGTAPTLTLKPDAQLWPLDHTYRTLTMSQMVQSLSDACNTTLSLSDVKIEKVTSDEPDDAIGNNDNINDIVIAADCRSVQLRAESDQKNGRVYVVTLRVRDASGNTTRKDFRVNVPISQFGVAVQDATAQTKTSGCP